MARDERVRLHFCRCAGWTELGRGDGGNSRGWQRVWYGFLAPAARGSKRRCSPSRCSPLRAQFGALPIIPSQAPSQARTVAKRVYWGTSVRCARCPAGAPQAPSVTGRPRNVEELRIPAVAERGANLTLQLVRSCFIAVRNNIYGRRFTRLSMA
jgi:hypothetical protein